MQSHIWHYNACLIAQAASVIVGFHAPVRFVIWVIFSGYWQYYIWKLQLQYSSESGFCICPCGTQQSWTETRSWTTWKKLPSHCGARTTGDDRTNKNSSSEEGRECKRLNKTDVSFFSRVYVIDLFNMVYHSQLLPVQRYVSYFSPTKRILISKLTKEEGEIYFW